MKTIELLSPAKNYETAIAAINSGADAIYIGATYFGARVNASNSLEDIKNLVIYAHKFYVSVHVAINTILNNSELNKAIELVKTLYNIGVDAIIVQDMGLLKALIDNKIPPIQLHISTQCDNRNLEKAKFFDGLGVSRIILARELSLEKIREICENVSCEVETFVHGALCVSYSGQCYLSYANGGRSANRGECAQPCRKKYSLIDSNGKFLLKDKYLLSLKDLNASEYVKNLIEFGVKSFKIEGRLKDINYVKNVTAYYSEIINRYANRVSSGKVFLDFEPNLAKTFNRGYTSYFLKHREQCFNFLSPKSMGEKLGKIIKIAHDHFVIDSTVSSQDGICFVHNGELKGFLVNKVIGCKVYPNKMDFLNVGTVLYRNHDSNFEKLLRVSKTVRKIGVSIFVNSKEVTIIDEDNNISTLELPPGEVSKNPQKCKDVFINQLCKIGESDYYIMNLSVDENNDFRFIPISKINEFRRLLLSNLTKVRLQNYKHKRQKPICYRDFYLRKIDYHANVLNNEAKKFYENCNCEVSEFALEKSAKISSGIELMRTKHCLKYSVGMCSKPCGKLYLKDGDKKYPLKFDCKNCEMIILNP